MATGTVVDVVMPQMGVSVSEGTVTRWLKNVGDTVQADEPLLEISTDKVDTEVPSPGTGVLQEILVQEGETVDVGTLVARIGPADGVAAAAPAPPAPLPASVEPEPIAPEPEPVPEPVAAEAEPAPAAPAQSGNGSRGERPTFVSPVVARIASEHGVDPAAVTGTGRDGRVTKKDILAFVESGGSPAPAAPEAAAPVVPPAAAPPAAAPPAVAPQAAAPPAAAPPSAPAAAPAPLEAGETLEPMTAMRRGIAEHMRRSLDTAAHVTSAIEVDMSKVVATRERLKREYVASYGVNPTYLAFIARAIPSRFSPSAFLTTGTIRPLPSASDTAKPRLT